jgi:hypothetical protein
MQKKLMQKYYGGGNITQPVSVQRERDINGKSSDVGYFEYCDRGTKEFMKGRKCSRSNKKKNRNTILEMTCQMHQKLKNSKWSREWGNHL